MRKLEALKKKRSKEKKKKEKNVFSKLESLFSSYYYFITYLHFKDDFYSLRGSTPLTF
jgi:hypothetical protein